MEFHQFIYVFVFPLGTQPEPSFVQFGEHEPEMTPFFRNDGAYLFDETFFRGVTLDEGDAAGGGFLFAPGMVGEDVFERDRSEVDPTRVRGKLEA